MKNDQKVVLEKKIDQTPEAPPDGGGDSIVALIPNGKDSEESCLVIETEEEHFLLTSLWRWMRQLRINSEK